MKLEAAGLYLDLGTLFRKPLRTLPERICLEGNPMHVEIAQRLLAKHAPHVTIAKDGELVTLMSLERYGSSFLGTLLEGTQPVGGMVLLHTIPEEMLIAYAKRECIPVVREEKDDVRDMLDRIAAAQPQTYFSLARSAERLAEHAAVLPENAEKES